MQAITQWKRIMTRALCFSRDTEFRAELRNLLFSAEF